MKYYKLCHDLPYDPLLSVIARRAKLRRGETLAIWVSFLDHASKSTPRGSLRQLDLEKIAAALELETPQVEAALNAFRDKKMIAYQAIADWNKIQSPSSARVRKHRRLKAPTPQNPDAAAAVEQRRKRLQAARLEAMKQHGREILP